MRIMPCDRSMIFSRPPRKCAAPIAGSAFLTSFQAAPTRQMFGSEKQMASGVLRLKPPGR
jgi:hypothetical protein